MIFSYAQNELKFIYSEKAENFCEISTVDLSYVVTVKSRVEILQNFVAFSEYMNFRPPAGYARWIPNWGYWLQHHIKVFVFSTALTMMLQTN